MKVGIIGMGFMGMTHLAGWRKTPAEVVGGFSLEYRDQVSDLRRFDTVEELLAAVDVVDICTPTHLHHEYVLKAAAAGKHVICEKPLGRTLQQGKEMIRACREAGVQLLVAHVVRFFPEYAAAKTAVERGDIGDVAVVRLTRASFKPGAPDSWFHNHEQSGGMVMDLMIHDFDYARWIAGDVVSVFAKRAMQQFPQMDGDYCVVMLRHKNNAISNIEGGWAYPRPMFRTALEIAGSAGLIEHPAGSSTPLGIYLKQNASGSQPDIAVPLSPLAEDPYVTEIRHFYRVLTEGIAPRVTAEDGLEALRISLAAIQSARTGKRVLMEELS
jgi:predicted dehydrogenase